MPARFGSPLLSPTTVVGFDTSFCIPGPMTYGLCMHEFILRN